MNVILNGQHIDQADSATLADLVAEITSAPQGIAVALNGTVVPRGAWAQTAVNDADQVEVLTAVQGG